jgi:transcriptional regulator
MYVPASFAQTDLSTLHDFIQTYSFATLVSHDGSAPFASQLPFLLDRTAGTSGRLISHMARANPQWRHAAGQSVRVLFQGPHAYVSPAWYQAMNVVPTWNYVTVQAVGTLRLVDQPEQILDIVRRTVEQYESGRDNSWSLEMPEARFVETLLSSIVGLEIDIDRLEGKWKLSQNHPTERREKVIAALRQNGDADSLAIAGLMEAGLRPG